MQTAKQEASGIASTDIKGSIKRIMVGMEVNDGKTVNLIKRSPKANTHNKIMKKQIAVQRSLSLPRMETGYHAQGILGQSYKGIHAGITVPLWENKNKVKAAKANLDYATASKLKQIIEHRFENKVYYDQLGVRLKSMREYKEFLAATVPDTVASLYHTY